MGSVGLGMGWEGRGRVKPGGAEDTDTVTEASARWLIPRHHRVSIRFSFLFIICLFIFVAVQHPENQSLHQWYIQNCVAQNYDTRLCSPQNVTGKNQNGMSFILLMYPVKFLLPIVPLNSYFFISFYSFIQ